MTKKDYLIIASSLLFAALIALGVSHSPVSSAAQLNIPVYNYSYLSQATTGTVLAFTPGVLHTVTVDFPAASSAITFYDSANTNIVAPTVATATIFVGPSGATSTASSTYSFTINGANLTTASVGNGSSTTDIAIAMTTAINASSSAVNGSATSSANVVTLTSSMIGPIGNFNIPNIPSQNGFFFQTTFGNDQGTPIIAQITLPATLLEQGGKTSQFDVFYKKGLVVKQVNGTSTVTVSYQQN